uniref:Ig-like domain-containing protein n=1 Tax=Esox lucius TaxID=8010 RepID=A0AAY5K3C4_ESOLU
MSLRSTGSVSVVFLWYLTVVLGQGDWGVTYSTQSICVLKGSTVELSCTYKYPGGHKVTSTFWFTKYDADGNPVNLSDDPDYRGCVMYRSDEKNRHTLIITDLRESDSVEYKFRITTDQPEWTWVGRPGVTLSVTGLQVEVTGGKMKTLTCRTTCSLTGNPTYIWYKNGQQIDESSSPQYKDPVYSNYEDSYSCSVKGHEDLHSPTVCECLFNTGTLSQIQESQIQESQIQGSQIQGPSRLETLTVSGVEGLV